MVARNSSSIQRRCGLWGLFVSLTICYCALVVCHRVAVVDSFSQPLRTLVGIGHDAVGLSTVAVGLPSGIARTKTMARASSLGHGEEVQPKPTAVLAIGNSQSSQEEQSLRFALELAGYGTVVDATTLSTDDDASAYWYEISRATGMLKLVSSPAHDSSFDPPRWVPIVRGEENVLVANGWSFLDPDESEPMSAFDIDDANAESEYRPKWGASNEKDGAEYTFQLSPLGYDISPLSKENILVEADSLSSDGVGNPYSRGVLLDGQTDPPNTKLTCNGFDFTGSTGKADIPSGIYFTAIGGLPLFSSTDLSPTTASSGWLSFARPLDTSHVRHVHPGDSSMDRRIEVVCARTGCHLGHYFGPTEGYCINASALKFVPSNEKSSNTNHHQTSSSRNILPVASRPISWRPLDDSNDRLPLPPSHRVLKAVLEHGGNFEMVALGCGCFWHAEDALRRLQGVHSTRACYAGGHTTLPTYESVCEGTTGHAEAVAVVYDPDVCLSNVLFDCFLALHDPTKVRAHGKHALQTGQYRSCMFVTTMEQENVANRCLEDCRQQLGKELSTEIRRMAPAIPSDTVSIDDLGKGWCWSAEDRHQRHDEKRKRSLGGADGGKDDGSSSTTLTDSEWLNRYGKRTPSIMGSSTSMEASLNPEDDGMAMMMI